MSIHAELSKVLKRKKGYAWKWKEKHITKEKVKTVSRNGRNYQKDSRSECAEVCDSY